MPSTRLEKGSSRSSRFETVETSWSLKVDWLSAYPAPPRLTVSSAGFSASAAANQPWPFDVSIEDLPEEDRQQIRELFAKFDPALFELLVLTGPATVCSSLPTHLEPRCFTAGFGRLPDTLYEPQSWGEANLNNLAESVCDALRTTADSPEDICDWIREKPSAVLRIALAQHAGATLERIIREHDQALPNAVNVLSDPGFSVQEHWTTLELLADIRLGEFQATIRSNAIPPTWREYGWVALPPIVGFVVPWGLVILVAWVFGWIVEGFKLDRASPTKDPAEEDARATDETGPS